MACAAPPGSCASTSRLAASSLRSASTGSRLGVAAGASTAATSALDAEGPALETGGVAIVTGAAPQPQPPAGPVAASANPSPIHQGLLTRITCVPPLAARGLPRTEILEFDHLPLCAQR